MKRIIGVLMVAMVVAFIVPVQAQIKFGLKGGLNLAKADFNKSDYKSDNFTGFFIGPMVDFRIPIVGLGVDGAVMFSQRGVKIDDFQVGTSPITYEGGTVKQNGIEIPLNLKYSFGLGNTAAIFLAAGPDFFFNFSGNKKIGDYIDFDTKNAEVGINLGGGVKLLNHLQLGVNYNIPLTDSADSQYTSYKTNIWQVSVAYLF